MKKFIYLLIVSLILITQSLNAQWVRSGVTYDIFFFFEAIPNHVGGGTNLFAGSGTCGIYHSTDDGTSWNQVNKGGIGGARALVVMDTILFVAGGSVFLTSNNGSSWTHIGLDSIIVTALAIKGTDLYAGTNNGVWRSPLTEIITSTESLTNLPSNLILDQNYPNPFTDHTSLHFSLAENGLVTIKIYDLTGRLVRELVMGTYSSGILTIDWNGTDSNGKRVNAGIYAGRMTVGSQSKTI